MAGRGSEEVKMENKYQKSPVTLQILEETKADNTVQNFTDLKLK